MAAAGADGAIGGRFYLMLSVPHCHLPLPGRATCTHLLLRDHGLDISPTCTNTAHYANNNIDLTNVNLGPHNDHREQTISNLLSDLLVSGTITTQESIKHSYFVT